jgi:hypothetical protein
MNFEIMPQYFLVKINKKNQSDFKLKISKDSPFFMPVGSVHNSRNMECGEIVQIGEQMRGTDIYDAYLGEERSGIYGWEKCKVGDTLVFHHTIESPFSNKKQDAHYFPYFLYEDGTFNYYAVDFINVRGFYDGITVTPHPNFIFLKNVPAFPNNDEIDPATGNKVRKTPGGIFLVTDWEDSPQDIAQRSQKIKEHIESLTKSTRTPDIQKELEKMEGERQMLNRKAQMNKFLPYRVAYSNRRIDRDFGRKIKEDDVVYCYNKACMYISNFKIKEYRYILCPVEHIGGLSLNSFRTSMLQL